MRIRLYLEHSDPGLRRLSIDPPAGDPAAPGAGGSGSSGAAPPVVPPAGGAPPVVPPVAPPVVPPVTPPVVPPVTPPPVKDEKPPGKDAFAEQLAAQQQEIARLSQAADRAAAHAKRQAMKAFFPDIVDDDAIALAPAPEFTESGELTTESKRKLTEWRASKPHFFTTGGDAGRRSTPHSQGGGALEMSAEQKQQLIRAGIPVTDPDKIQNAHKLAHLFGGPR